MPADRPPPPQAPRPAGRRTRLRRLLLNRLPWLLLATSLVTLVTLLTLMQPMPRFDRMLQDNARADMRQTRRRTS